MDWLPDFMNKLFSLEAPSLEEIEEAYQLKEQFIPDTIYKFRTFDTEGRSLSNLEEGYVWLADPLTLNDPFDCAHRIDPGFIMKQSSNDLPSLSNTLTKQQLTDLNQSLIGEEKSFIDCFIDVFNKDGTIGGDLDVLRHVFEKRMEIIQHEFSDRVRQSFKLCSFTERLNSPLMWAHYADSHRGFCIAYDIKSHMPNSHMRRLLYPVEYATDFFDATEFFIKGKDNKSFNNLYLSKAGLIKSVDWSYEKEWRLLFPHGILDTSQKFKVPPAKCVYVGTDITPENEIQLREICNRLGIQVFRMTRSLTKFEMVPNTVAIN